MIDNLVDSEGVLCVVLVYLKLLVFFSFDLVLKVATVLFLKKDECGYKSFRM